MVMFAVNANDSTDLYAVKCIERRKIRSQREMTMLQNESAIQAEIDSDYVVSLKHATQTPANFYLAMEMCNGGDLLSYMMDRGGFLCEREARMILKQIIKGLVVLKQKTVMHRDLKLPNIMLHFSALRPEVWTDPNHKMEDFRKNFDFASDFKHLKCKIADLGFARKCEEDDLAQTGCGTLF